MTSSRRPRVVVLDYGSGNLHSATRALEAAGADVTLSADPAVALAADGLVVPGVGAFSACMDGLVGVGGPQLILRRLAARKPVLGICVGHQVLFSLGVEHGDPTPGIAVLPGVVEELDAVPLPHMGWNTVEPPAASAMFAGIEHERFYFVHSFGVHEVPDWPGNARITWTRHGGDRFIAAVEQGPLWSTQFHPEKSGAAGARLLRNWLDTLPREES
ncbi:MAG: imidazole glycerol phosphate synthase subunit HisH [Actinobacteria bacterium]|nr:imidazole glycerol phosphate synthase subunit HisH [Actinomycetota bacterium]